MSKCAGPTVSVGMPVCNGEPYVETAIRSILEQTYENFELIISDNASTDRTEQICRDYSSVDTRIRYHRNTHNIGGIGNFNWTFELSTGPYFKWAAADDVCAPELLRRCVAVLDRDRDVVLCYGKTRIIDESGKVVMDYHDNVDLQEERPSARFKRLLLSMGLCNVQYGVIRSSVLRRTGGMGRFRASDYILLAELALHGKFCELPDWLFFRRLHGRSWSTNVEGLKQQMDFWGARRADEINRVLWRQSYEFASVALRAPICLVERLRVCAFILRRMMWQRGHLGRELLTILGRSTSERRG